MLSISRVNINQVSNYFIKDENYYAAEGFGKWHGKLADEINYQGMVEANVFDKEIKTLNEKALIQNKSNKKEPPQIGIDMTFSAPKSCSIAMNMSDDLRKKIINTWNDSIKESLNHIEDNYVYYRSKEKGIVKAIKAKGMVSSIFNHNVSRLHDPQLHSHCLILSKVKGINGKTYSLSGEMLFKNKMYLGQYQRNLFAKKLQDIGFKIEVTDRKNGFFEIAGFSKEQLKFMSKRRAEIEDYMKSNGMSESTGKEAAEAALKTRKSKKRTDWDKLVESWRSDFKNIGLNETDIVSCNFGTDNKIGKINKVKLFNEVADNFFKSSFAFRQEELSRELLKHGLGYGITQNEIDHFIKNQIEKKFLIDKELPGKRGFTQVYLTTKDNIELEKSIFEKVKNGKGKSKGIDIKIIDNYLKNTSLSLEQANCVKHICSSLDRFVAVQGYAGTGKTTMLNEARKVWEGQGYRVYGMSFQGKAAEGLKEGSGIASSTIHSFLNRLEKESAGSGGLGFKKDFKSDSWNLGGIKKNEKEVWVMDEASMTDNRLMASVQSAAEARGAKLIMIGDYRQFQPIRAGRTFSDLIQDKLIDFVSMRDIQRQKNDVIRDAVIRAAQGDIRQSLMKIENNIVECKDRYNRMKKIITNFSNRSFTDQKNTIILTGANSDRNYLNEKIHEKLAKDGLLKEGSDSNNIKIKSDFMVNEKIMFLENNKKIRVMNGLIGIIVDRRGDMLKVESNQKLINVDLNKYNKIDFGYCITSHKSQSITEDNVIVHIDTNQHGVNSANAYYVDISRAKHNLTIFTDDSKGLLKAVRDQQYKITSKDFDYSEGVNRNLPKSAILALKRYDINMSKINVLKSKISDFQEKAKCFRNFSIIDKGLRPKEISRNLKRADALDIKVNKIESKINKLNEKAEKQLLKAENILNKFNSKDVYEKIDFNKFSIEKDFELSKLGIDRGEIDHLSNIAGPEIKSPSADIEMEM